MPKVHPGRSDFLFLYENDLKSTFWDYYKNRKGILRYQFECPCRQGGIDLVTVEDYKGIYQICCFEFKLTDIKKAFLQAEYNLEFCHKSFIVVPIEKEKLIKDKYTFYLKQKKHIGVIGVHETGKWDIIYQPIGAEQAILNNQILSLIIEGK